METMSKEQAFRILADAMELDLAAIQAAKASAPFEVQVIELDLSTARLETAPYRIGHAFRSIFVIDATDSSAEVSMKLNTDASYQSPIPLKKNGGLKLPRSVANASLFWDAQAGKTMSLLVLVSGEFSSGQQISVSSGGVTLSDGETVEPQTAGTSGAAATVLFAADADRKCMVIQPHDGDIFISGSSDVTTLAGTKPGIKVPVGGTYEWRSSDACYVISDATVTQIGLNRFE